MTLATAILFWMVFIGSCPFIGNWFAFWRGVIKRDQCISKYTKINLCKYVIIIGFVVSCHNCLMQKGLKTDKSTNRNRGTERSWVRHGRGTLRERESNKSTHRNRGIERSYLHMTLKALYISAIFSSAVRVFQLLERVPCSSTNVHHTSENFYQTENS